MATPGEIAARITEEAVKQKMDKASIVRKLEEIEIDVAIAEQLKDFKPVPNSILDEVNDIQDFLVSTDVQKVVDNCKKLSLITSKLIEENEHLKKKVYDLIGMYLKAEVRLKGITSGGLYHFRTQA